MKKIVIILVVVAVIAGIGKWLLPLLIERTRAQAVAEIEQRAANLQPTTDPVMSPPPSLKGVAAARPEFHYGSDSVQTTGTVFFLKDKTGQVHLATAAHLYKAEEWSTMRKIVLHDLAEKPLGELQGKPLYVGKFTEDSPASNELLPNMAEDLMFKPVKGNLPVQPLKLASTLPAKNEIIWVVGSEVDKSTGQHFYPCKYVSTTEKLFSFKPVKPFNPEDFSGAPVINQAGEVIGTMNGSFMGSLMGTPLKAIRAKGAEKQIEWE
jgi:hypothetical protein